MIKHLLLTVAATIAFTFSYSQSGRVGIGTSNPEQKLDVAGSAKANDKVIGTRGFVAGAVTADTAKAIFSTDITNKGFYIPRLTTAQKTTLGGTLNGTNKGLLVFDTDLNRTDFWDGSAWKAVGDGAGGPPTGAAGGDLTGTYPNPSIGNNKVTSAHILDGTITGTDIQNNTIDLTQKVNNVLPVSNGGTGVNTITGAVIGNGSSPVSGVASSSGNQVLRRNNTNTAYEFAQVQYSDVAGTPSTLPPSGTAGGDLTGTYPSPTIANNAVTTGKILDGTITAADLATTGVTANTYNNVTVNSKGQVTGGSNAAYLTGNQNITLSGDVSGSGTTAISTTIGSNTVTNTKLSDMAQNRIKGRYSSGSGDPEDLTPAQALSVLGITAPTGDNLGNHTATTTLNMSGNGITNVPSLNSPSDNIGFFTNRADDNSYEWIGYYSGGTRQGIMLWDGAWSGANNLTNEFSLTAENSNLLTLNTNNNHIALMPKNGNVGIGTTNPAQGKLWVHGGDIWVAGNNTKLAFSTDYSTDPIPNASIVASENGFSGTSADLIFNTWNGAANTEIMRVRSNGNVGIGTTNPVEKLQVNGNIMANGIVYWGDDQTRTESREDAGLQGNAGAKSGFYQTSAPSPASSWPSGASGWWHLLDVRHSNPINNYAMQFAGSFFDQNIYFRKTNNSASTAWQRIPGVMASGQAYIGDPGISIPSVKKNDFNFSSISRLDNNGTDARYQFNFSAALPTDNYVVILNSISNNTGNWNNDNDGFWTIIQTTTTYFIAAWIEEHSGTQNIDMRFRIMQ
ncbi:MAG: hypothetical protein BGO32_06315 [Bacteroidetes bacterium 37-13]|nr:MAG: hypothetical protein BGO32_06315 [Bacteroidetes bacterium 37-13]